MSRKSNRRVSGTVPAPRTKVKLPPSRPIQPPPGGSPMAHVPRQRVGRAPAQRAAGKPPNPRKPRLVRDVNGGALRDLFAFFPDLPRPARPAPRVPARGAGARRSRRSR